MESHMLHGELVLASHRVLTEQSIFIKDSEQFQSIFWNHIIRGTIWPHLNVHRRCVYEGREGESDGLYSEAAQVEKAGRCFS